MFEIREYCYNLLNSTSILQKCIDSGFIPDSIKSVDELEGADQAAYEKEKKYQLGLYEHSWRDVIMNHLKCEQPNFVNANLLNNSGGSTEPLYIYPAYMTSGK